MPNFKFFLTGSLVGLLFLFFTGSPADMSGIRLYPAITRPLSGRNFNLHEMPVHYRQKAIFDPNVLGKTDPMYRPAPDPNAGLDAALPEGPIPEELGSFFAEAILPVDPEYFNITSPFGPRGEEMHFGVDIASEGIEGQNVYAVMAGTVEIAAPVGDFGNLVILRHGNIQTYYGHLESIKVSPGDEVTKGQIIGLVGNTGDSTGPHLHFEIRMPVNPLPFLEGLKQQSSQEEPQEKPQEELQEDSQEKPQEKPQQEPQK